jgi:diguanylate cyclase (GGDEF)-like protein/PAS domain S-box-containing protein
MHGVVEGGEARAGRAMEWFGRQVGDPVAAAGGRLASALFLLCGALVAASAGLPLPSRTNVGALLGVGAAAMAVGLVLWLLPWDRWRPSASLFAIVPPALVLIGLHNWATGADGFRYGLFFLVLFAWVGLSHPPGTSVRVVPLLVVAYVAPMVWLPHVSPSSFASIAYAGPICVLVGETTAAVAARLRRAEAAHRASEARWRSLVLNASDLILVLGPDGVVEYATPAVVRLFGYDEAATAGMQVLDIVHPDDLDFAVERLGRSLDHEGPGEHIELRVRRADGTYTWVESIGTNLLDEPSVRGIVCNVRDISDRKEAERVLLHRARHDSLTGLPNRHHLMERALELLDGCDGVALLLLDLDHFKDINDGLGHELGDRVLVEVAHRLAVAIDPEHLVARLGGDEFAVVLPVDGVDVVAVAATLRAAFDRTIEIDGMSLHVGASIGVAVAAGGGAGNDAVTLLLQHADVAMYRAKAAGAGWAVFGSEDEEDRPARLAMVHALRVALEDGSLDVHYQPQRSLADGSIDQVEVLARWTRDGRSVDPSVFIALAEQTGLIGLLTERVLDRSLAQCRRWADVGLLVAVCVNVSARTLRDTAFPAAVAAALERSGVPATDLTLEITESALAEQTDAVVEVLQSLRATGVRLSIDDFGAGYSSMAYLKRLPIDELKIDRAFVTDMLSDTRDQPITRAIIELAHSLGLTVVAEGIESPALEDVLRRLGCDAGQGYGICRPVPAEELTAWLAAARTPPAPHEHIAASPASLRAVR